MVSVIESKLNDAFSTFHDDALEPLGDAVVELLFDCPLLAGALALDTLCPEPRLDPA